MKINKNNNDIFIIYNINFNSFDIKHNNISNLYYLYYLYNVHINNYYYNKNISSKQK